MDLHKILVAVDFSPSSERAIDAALALAGDAKTTIELLHVCELPPYSTPGVGMYIPSPELVAAQVAEARPELDGLRVSCMARGAIVGTACVAAASVADEIVDYAAEHGFDLIVMGSHGRHGIGRFVLGSVAEKVVRLADRPVLTVHEHDLAWRPMPAAASGL